MRPKLRLQFQEAPEVAAQSSLKLRRVIGGADVFQVR